MFEAMVDFPSPSRPANRVIDRCGTQLGISQSKCSDLIWDAGIRSIRLLGASSVVGGCGALVAGFIGVLSIGSLIRPHLPVAPPQPGALAPVNVGCGRWPPGCGRANLETPQSAPARRCRGHGGDALPVGIVQVDES